MADAERRKRDKLSGKATKRNALSNAKRRAKEQGVPFTLTMDNLPDIPTICPVLGIPIVPGSAGHQPNSPSLDKIIPEFGYIPENVQWISNRANELKRDATPTELIQVGLYFAKRVEKVFEDRGASFPRKGLPWLMEYWDWYEQLDFDVV